MTILQTGLMLVIREIWHLYRAAINLSDVEASDLGMKRRIRKTNLGAWCTDAWKECTPYLVMYSKKGGLTGEMVTFPSGLGTPGAVGRYRLASGYIPRRVRSLWRLYMEYKSSDGGSKLSDGNPDPA